MIIVEGPDGSGKTSLVVRLQRDLRLPVAPRAVSAKTEALVDLARWTEENTARGFQYTIFDRHRLISEPIYGPILRPRQDTKFLDLAWMNEQMWLFYQASPIIIYCLPYFETVVQNIQNPETDNERVRDPRIAEAIYASYVSRATADFARGVGRLYNYRSTLYVDVLRWIRFQLEVRHERASRGRELRHQAG